MCRCGCCVAGSGAVFGSVSGLQHHLGEVGLPHTVARVVWVSHAVDLQVAAAERRRLGLPGCGSLQQPRQPADPAAPPLDYLLLLLLLLLMLLLRLTNV